MEDKKTQIKTPDNKGESNKPKKSKKKTIIFSITVGVVSATIGAMGGYVLYGNVHPEQDDIIIDKGTKADSEKIQDSLNNGTLVEDYADSVYEIINYSCDLYASSPYSLTLGNGLVNAAAGVKQTIVSTTYNYPDGAFNQKVSLSSVVQTADRYYDNNNEVKGYECKYESDWQSDSLEPKTYNYDEYIQSFGKLLRGKYYCVDLADATKDQIPEKFLTFDKTTYDESDESSKHEVNGVIGYSVTKKTVSSATINKTDDGYHAELELNIPNAVSYVTVQMKTTGRLKARPTFSNAKLTFDLDEKLNLVSSVFHDEYRVNTGGLVTSATSNLNQIYLTSDSWRFVYNEKTIDVKVPGIKEEFNGYQFMSETE